MITLNWPAIGFTVLPNLGGIAGSFVTRPYLDKWYEELKRPSWRPPNWVFGPVWTSLYCSMGYSSYLVFRDGAGLNGIARLPLAVYGANLIVNWAWAPIFFKARNIQLAFYDILLVDVTAAGMAYLFSQVNKTAGLLIVPYCLWLSLATTLSYCITRDNKDFKPSQKITEVKDK